MTAFDELIKGIAKEGFHNHRSSKHSDVLSKAYNHSGRKGAWTEEG